MKLLSFIVPCYNSEDYLCQCIESLLPGGDEVEILIINDGSTDHTGEIAEEFSIKYPERIKVVHQENSGHGGAIMTGLQSATGYYFKVVDSDDRVDEQAYYHILETIRNFIREEQWLDLIVSNYVYDKIGVKHKKVMHYENALPKNRVLSWDEVGRLRKGQYILMHSVIYRTKLLRECGLSLPRNTFYVDNLYVYIPMQKVKSLYYLNVDFYHYFIGREDQSVNEAVMIKRIDQQIKVNKIMLHSVDLSKIDNLRLRQYLISYLEIVTMVSSVLLIRSGESEHLNKKRQLWDYIRHQDIWIYYKLRYGIMGQIINLPGKVGRKIILMTYKISQRIIGFN